MKVIVIIFYSSLADFKINRKQIKKYNNFCFKFSLITVYVKAISSCYCAKASIVMDEPDFQVDSGFFILISKIPKTKSNFMPEKT
jgi:hypothetical protein